MTRLLFGINVSTSAGPGSDPVSDATEAEALGFDFVSASDHPCGTHPTRETWTMLTWIAASTSRVAVMPRVLGAPFRNPVLVAKMAETLDRLSGGRLILGLGGGGSEDEIRSMGLPARSPGRRIEGLEDAARIVRGLWAESPFTYEGAEYACEAAALAPKPSHRIPIWLGTFGPRALAVTGRVADGWIPTLGYAPADRLAGMRHQVLAAADDAGRDPAEVACILNVQVSLDGARGDHPDAIAGSADEIVEQLRRFVEMGFVGFNFLPVEASGPGQPQRIAAEVVPALAAA